MIRLLRSHIEDHERHLAKVAADHIHAELYAGAWTETPKAFSFNLPSEWMRRIFFEMCNIHGLVGFHECGMWGETVMTIAPPTYMQHAFVPTLNAAIVDVHAAMDQLTTEYIERLVGSSSDLSSPGSSARHVAVPRRKERRKTGDLTFLNEDPILITHKDVIDGIRLNYIDCELQLQLCFS